MFNSQSASLEVICNAGDKILVNLYNGKPKESLHSLSLSFCRKVASGMSHKNHKFTPTAAAEKYHNLRVFYISDSAMEGLYGET